MCSCSNSAFAMFSGNDTAELDPDFRIVIDNRAKEFHRLLPDYHRSTLRPLQEETSRFGLGQIVLKGGYTHTGFSVIHILGVSWAVYRMIESYYLSTSTDEWTIEELAAKAKLRNHVLITATDGDHGQAMAYMAKQLGIKAEIFVPQKATYSKGLHDLSKTAVVHIVDGDRHEAMKQALMAYQQQHNRALLLYDPLWKQDNVLAEVCYRSLL